MRYTVNWTEAAQDELAAIWLQASDRQAVTEAAHRIDLLLRADAHLRGQECDGDRMLHVWPLMVFFAVVPSDSRVDVLSVTYQGQ